MLRNLGKIHSGKKVLFLDKIVFERTWDPT